MLDPTALIAAARRVAMDRLEKGVRVGSELMVELLRKTVDGSGGMQRRTKMRPSIIYRRQTKHGGRFEKYPPEWDKALRMRDIAPGKRTGAGQNAIGYKIVDRDDSKGEIRVWIGVDDSAPGGIHMPGGYMMAWETGIRVREPGDPIKGKRSGPVIQRPWLRTTFDRYFDSYTAVVASVAAQQ
jgi:hypothetical protein